MREVSFFNLANLVGYDVEIVHKTKGVLRGRLFAAGYDHFAIITKDSKPKAKKFYNSRIISIRELEADDEYYK